MDFERQKPVSDEYRENWERVFRSGDMRNRPSLMPVIETPFGRFAVDPSMPRDCIGIIDRNGRRLFMVNIGLQKDDL